MPHPDTRNLRRRLLALLLTIVAAPGTLAPTPGFAIQNTASGSASGTPLDTGSGTVTL